MAAFAQYLAGPPALPERTSGALSAAKPRLLGGGNALAVTLLAVQLTQQAPIRVLLLLIAFLHSYSLLFLAVHGLCWSVVDISPGVVRASSLTSSQLAQLLPAVAA